MRFCETPSGWRNGFGGSQSRRYTGQRRDSGGVQLCLSFHIPSNHLAPVAAGELGWRESAGLKNTR